jgi:voltage-gated potassium channel
LRDRYNAFIERHEVAWELVMAALAVAYVGVGFALDAADPVLNPTLLAIETTLTIIFVGEFVTRFGAAYDRGAYLRGHWLDLVALIPVVRGVRIFRLVRLLRLVRAFAGVHRSLTRLERLVRHRGLAGIFVAWLGVMVLTSIGLYVAESGVNPAVSSPWDALWWGVTTMTTVG